MKKNLILNTDSYKMSHFLQYPEDTRYVSSYIEARGGAQKSVFFGLQAFIMEYLLNPITAHDVSVAEKIAKVHGEPFNREGWDIIVNEHGGYLPVEIQAVPEGTVMDTRNVQVQVVNTDPRLPWVTSYLETAILRAVWYPSTVASISRECKIKIATSLEMSSDIPVADQIGFKLHDFGARGASSHETAGLGGMGHLVNFMGTDTIAGIVHAMMYYNADVCGFSIPAAEHSTITSWGRNGETDAYKNMIAQFGGGLYAVVSDSYDIFNACENIWPSLKDEIVAKGGTIVIRPDSGDPMTMPVEVLKMLHKGFGGTINSKGFIVLPEYIRVIQGDGINADTLPTILENVIAAGFSTENIAFGMGGGLLQEPTRDTLKYAMKASARMGASDEWIPVYKDPITDKGKQSKKGRLALVFNGGIGSESYKTIPEDVVAPGKNLLQTVYRNGKLLKMQSFKEIRERAALVESEYVETIVERY